MHSVIIKINVVVTVALFLVLATQASAQVDTGAILGTVSDTTGAVIPGVTVKITNEETSLSQESQTRADGTYIFTPVRIGVYSVETEYAGFRTARRTGIRVSIQQQVVVDVALEPGEVTQVIEVQGAAPLLQTTSGQVGEVVTSKVINNLPLSGRNYNFLARLTAGVTHAQSEGRGLESSGWFVANGTRAAQNNFLLDGIDNNSNNVDFLSGAAYVVQPPVDAIGEFKLQTSSFSAEFGRAGGAVLNVSLKSGTNEVHGSVWEFLRNNKLDGADFFQNAAGIEPGTFQQNQFGGAVGGPIVKNKTFFFFDFEGTRIRKAAVKNATVPTQAERDSGFTDFSDLITLQSGSRGPDPLGREFPSGTIFDPTTTRQVAGGWVRDPFPGNIIPADRISKVALGLMELYPAPKQAGLNNNYYVNRGRRIDANSFDVRIDHSFSVSDFVFGRYSRSTSERVNPSVFEGVADGGGFSDGSEDVTTQGAAISYTHTFSPTMINEVRIGFNREHVYRLQANGDDTSDIPGTYGIPGIQQRPGNGGLPQLRIGGMSRLGAGGWLVSERFSNTFQLTENLTKIYGSHSFKGGFEGQYVTFPWAAPPNSRGAFRFDGLYTSAPNFSDSSTGRAQFLVEPRGSTVGGPGKVGGANQVGLSNFGYIDNERFYYGAFFQDDWKVSQRLTLNLGVRWEHFTLVGERYGAQANFVEDFATGQGEFFMPATRQGDPQMSQGFLNALDGDGIKLVYTDKYGSGLGNAQKANLAPRFGFAYELTDKLVLRGGYGIFFGAFENRGGSPSLSYNYPFQYDFTFRSTDDHTPLIYPDGYTATLERGVLSIPLDPSVAGGRGLNLRGIQFNYKTPYTQGYNLTFQYELMKNHSLEVGYVASLGHHLEAFIGNNHASIILPPGTNAELYKPFQNFARNGYYASTTGDSNYHSMQTKFTRRFSNGLNLLFTHTWAKTITNAGDLLNPGNIGGFRNATLPDFGLQYDYGLATFHINHAFSFAGTYELPFGRGMKYLSGASATANAILGGWSINWMAPYYTGQPVTIDCAVSTTSGSGCYALMVPGVDPYIGKLQPFFNPAAFATPDKATQVGQSDYSPLGGGRSQVTGPPFRKIDFSVFKNWQFKERYRLEFRAESFNLTNTPSFANPGSLDYINTTNFARITSTRNSGNDARQIQLALKLYF